MRKHGRHARPPGRTTPRAARPGGYRPLSLVPALSPEPATDTGDRHDGATERAAAQARARELEAWAADHPPPVGHPRADRSASGWNAESERFVRDALRQFDRRAIDVWAERWGGHEALHQLDAVPLPDEPFDWSAVPVAHRAQVERILALVDEACGLWFDREHRTACRRLLARVAGDPTVITHRGKLQTIAGAIVWTIASFNGTTGSRRRRGIVPASWIAGGLGLSSGSAFAGRSRAIRLAAGIELIRYGTEPIGEPALIVSRRRRRAVEVRDRQRHDADG